MRLSQDQGIGRAEGKHEAHHRRSATTAKENGPLVEHQPPRRAHTRASVLLDVQHGQTYSSR